jgi:hypothetical protein
MKQWNREYGPHFGAWGSQLARGKQYVHCKFIFQRFTFHRLRTNFIIFITSIDVNKFKVNKLILFKLIDDIMALPRLLDCQIIEVWIVRQLTLVFLGICLACGVRYCDRTLPHYYSTNAYGWGAPCSMLAAHDPHVPTADLARC